MSSLSQLPIPDQLVKDLDDRESGKVTLVIDRGGQPAKVVASRHCIKVLLVPTIVIVDDPWEYPSVVWQSSLNEIVAIEIEPENGQQPVRWLRKHEKFDFLRVEGDLPEVALYSPHDAEHPVRFFFATEGGAIGAAMEAARLESQIAELETQRDAKVAAKAYAEAAQLDEKIVKLHEQLAVKTSAPVKEQTAPTTEVDTPAKSKGEDKLTLSQAVLVCKSPEANKRLKKVLARYESDENFSDSEFVAVVEALL